MVRFLLVVYALLFLAACGGGGGGVSGPSRADLEKVPVPEMPKPEIRINYRRVRDSMRKNEVMEFLRDALLDDNSVSRHATAPTLRMAEGTTAKERTQVERAVQFVNSALPYSDRIIIGDNVPDRSGIGHDGEIRIDFAPTNEWPVNRGTATATAFSRLSSNAEGIPTSRATHIWLDKNKTDHRDAEWNMAFLVHEILHALGFGSHTDPSLTSIMKAQIDHPQTRSDQPKELLFPLDRDGLAALYMLNPGDSLDDLGPWSEVSTNISGEFAGVSFGVRANNGIRTPWTRGQLSRGAPAGSASWIGKLIGFTPLEEAVTGAADLSIDLSRLTGVLLFDDMERWSVGHAPENGSGETWNDGDLSYGIQVSGNTFVRTSGDDGEVKGAFYGTDYEGAAGTLERSDLTAAFGAMRQ